MQEPIAGLDPPNATALFGPMGRSLLKLCKLAAIAGDRKSTRLNSSHLRLSRMPSSA